MAYNISFGQSIIRLLDNHQRLTRNTHDVYYRLRNFPDVQNVKWAQMGFRISPSGTQVGSTDILIYPPPSVNVISLHNIGQSMGKLRFGARSFLVSASFVDAQVIAQGLSDEDLVWRGPNFMGLVTDNMLFSVEDIQDEQVAGKTTSWILTCNANQLK